MITTYADCLFLLSPPEHIKNEIARYKKASLKYIGEFSSMQSPAHITVNQLERQKPYMVDAAFERIEGKLHAMPAILLHMDGFKYFEHLHGKMTIYAYIRSTPAMEDWFALLRKNLNIKKAITPHITVVRNIPEADYNKLWPNFKNKKLLEPFWIYELKVLQRETFGTTAGKWEPYKTIRFKNTEGFAGKDNWALKKQAEAEIAARKQIKLF
ncbi:2'-5' RNA ligase family protein [Mucilaginibacter glaciei]|uniref:2'-5' RNA ligase family protein n=1 Tax=Mucilaginibacter glaciei TaxID=2772109 RepID=A0A926S0X4_9SPHI|nr:2'-5' RNA ligase family protein [Mucilaginibacter glaciei]MBD1392172.1 2'-5' RNA ligase family protein [Mucilaginibacter glaciei]